MIKLARSLWHVLWYQLHVCRAGRLFRRSGDLKALGDYHLAQARRHHKRASG